MTKTYHMVCTCGHIMETDAKDRDEAIAKFQDAMDEDGIAVHMREYHPGEPTPTVAEVHQMINDSVAPAVPA